jgi:hypothetical protein
MYCPVNLLESIQELVSGEVPTNDRGSDNALACRASRPVTDKYGVCGVIVTGRGAKDVLGGEAARLLPDPS